MARQTIRTLKKRAAFIGQLATGASVAKASMMAGFGRQSSYDWRGDDEDFAADWDQAVETGTDLMEDEMRRRAVEGVAEPKFHNGEVCGHVQRYSDTLLIFMLKARRPEKFKDRAEVEHKGQVVFKMDFGTGLEALPGPKDTPMIEQRKMKRLN